MPNTSTERHRSDLQAARAGAWIPAGWRQTLDAASALLSAFAATGMVHEFSDGTPTANAAMCLRLVREIDEMLAAAPAAAPTTDDAKRLDWLEQQRSVALTRLRLSAKPDALLYWCVEDWDGNDLTEETEPAARPTLRAAIDAAMGVSPSPATAERSQP